MDETIPTSRLISSLTKLYGYDIGDEIEILSYCHDGDGGVGEVL